MGAAHAGLDGAVRGLQEAAVQAEDFGGGVAGQALEGFGAVDDGHVGLGGVAEEEGAGGVDGADGDRGVRAEGDGNLRGGGKGCESEGGAEEVCEGRRGRCGMWGMVGR